MYRNTYAKIDLRAIKNNVKNAVSFLSESSVLMAVVKSDAYGHGAVAVATAALESGAAWLAVAMSEEAVELRESGIDCPIFVLGVSNEEQMRLALELHLDLCIASVDELNMLIGLADKREAAKIHLKVDTGMGRIGFCGDDEFLSAIDILGKNKNIEFRGLFSHLACADEKDDAFTQNQRRLFEKYRDMAYTAGYRPVCHLCNSAGLINDKSMHYDMVRFGISLYGYYSSGYVNSDNVALEPAMSVCSKIVFLKKIKDKTTVSYGATYSADGDRMIATIPIGYGDGYNRLLSGKGRMIVIHDEKAYYARIAGRVCMDQTMLDVTHIPNVKCGDDVVVLGSYGGRKVDADELAGICGTISYEILLSFSKRVPREYHI